MSILVTLRVSRPHLATTPIIRYRLFGVKLGGVPCFTNAPSKFYFIYLLIFTEEGEENFT